MKRVFLFLLTNILVVLSISVAVNVLGINKYMTPYGINYKHLMMFCLVWGMVGSVISLLLSKVMAKKAYNLTMINQYSSNNIERVLYQMVDDLARRAGMSKTPEVGYYDSEEVNAFATGWREGSSLVAVSTGLVNSLDQKAIEAVLAHEIAHIKNGDMVTMTLVQGVINAFVMFFARVLAFFISSFISKNRDGSPSYLVNSILTFLFEIILTVLGSVVVFWFSRHREYKADFGGAKLTSKSNMILALSQLQNGTHVIKDNFATMKISGTGFMELFSTHPSIEKRIKALQNSHE